MNRVEVTSTPPANDADVDLTMTEINEILFLAREAKNRRISVVMIQPDYKRAGSLFVRGGDLFSARRREP